MNRSVWPAASVRRRVTVQPADQPPAAPRPARGADELVRIADLPEYLRRHGLRAVRLDWPDGSSNPNLIVEDAPDEIMRNG